MTWRTSSQNPEWLDSFPALNKAILMNGLEKTQCSGTSAVHIACASLPVWRWRLSFYKKVEAKRTCSIGLKLVATNKAKRADFSGCWSVVTAQRSVSGSKAMVLRPKQRHQFFAQVIFLAGNGSADRA